MASSEVPSPCGACESDRAVRPRPQLLALAWQVSRAYVFLGVTSGAPAPPKAQRTSTSRCPSLRPSRSMLPSTCTTSRSTFGSWRARPRHGRECLEMSFNPSFAGTRGHSGHSQTRDTLDGGSSDLPTGTPDTVLAFWAVCPALLYYFFLDPLQEGKPLRERVPVWGDWSN